MISGYIFYLKEVVTKHLDGRGMGQGHPAKKYSSYITAK
jgi:hypothetical protein